MHESGKHARKLNTNKQNGIKTFYLEQTADAWGNLAVMPKKRGIFLMFEPLDSNMYLQYTIGCTGFYWYIKLITNSSAYAPIGNEIIAGTVYYLEY